MGENVRLLLTLDSVLGLHLSNMWKPFFRLAGQPKKLSGWRSSWWLGYWIPNHFLPTVLWGSIEVPILQPRVWGISITSGLRKQKAGKGALDDRELWTRLQFSTSLIWMALEGLWLMTTWKASMDVLPSPTSDGEGFIRFGNPQGGGCDVPHRPQGCLLKHFHSFLFSIISQNCLGWQSLLVQGTLFRLFHSSTDLHQSFSPISEWDYRSGILLLWYLDDWLVISWEKSNLKQTSKAQCLGIIMDTIQERVYPADSRSFRFWEVADSFLSLLSPPAKMWQILGHMASLEWSVPRAWSGCCPFQWQLKSHWSPAMVPWMTCDASPLVRIPAMYHVTVTGGAMGIWSPSISAPSVSSVHRHVEGWLGCASAEHNYSRDMDKGGTQSPYQHIEDGGSSTGSWSWWATMSQRWHT